MVKVGVRLPQVWCTAKGVRGYRAGGTAYTWSIFIGDEGGMREAAYRRCTGRVKMLRLACGQLINQMKLSARQVCRFWPDAVGGLRSRRPRVERGWPDIWFTRGGRGEQRTGTRYQQFGYCEIAEGIGDERRITHSKAEYCADHDARLGEAFRMLWRAHRSLPPFGRDGGSGGSIQSGV